MKKLLILATLLSTTAFAADSSLHPNTEKYSDTGKKAATGRTGDATIEAMALRGRNGVTELSVTSNGNLDKVQVKYRDLTFNHQSSGSTFTTQITGLTRGTPIAVQANVSGADPARTGVVSATETVKNRPELVMQWVTAPPHALAGVPTHIVADVSEKWGDVGARTNCVLLQNGVELDRAANIWVDADGMVACEFATAFAPGSGTVNLTVALRDTMPADYDPRNDVSRPFEIKVYDSLTELESWNASASESKSYNRSFTTDAYGQDERISFGHTAGATFQATFRATQPNVESLRASVHLTTDGRILATTHDAWFDYQAKETWGPGMSSQCSVAVLDERNNFIRSCHLVTPWDGEYTYFNFSWGTGDVTYVSQGWYSWYVGGPRNYFWYYNRDVYGNGMELGESVTFDIQFSDGTNYWSANPTLALTTTSDEDSSPFTCYTEEGWSWCHEYSYQYTSKRGSASGGQQ